MKLTHKLFSMVITLVMLSSVLSAVPAYAASTSHPNGNFFNGLIQFIAQKFGLDQNQVQNAVTEYHQQVKSTITPRPTMTQQQFEDREKNRLDQLIKDGKITTTQEQAILTELTTLRNKYNLDQLQNLAPDQRHQKLQQMQNELKSWAQSQGINLQYLMMLGMDGIGKEMFDKEGFGRHKGTVLSVTPIPTQ